MNEKITIQSLIDSLVEKHALEKKDADHFVKVFFDLIEEALDTEKYVKIKGLGTFKLIEVDSRESINVNTGERIEIQGHKKISFTPENSLKELINKPFSHFETVVLNDNFKEDLEIEGKEKIEINGDEPFSNINLDSVNQINKTEETPTLSIENSPLDNNDDNVIEIQTEKNSEDDKTNPVLNSDKKKVITTTKVIICIIILILIGILGFIFLQKSKVIIFNERVNESVNDTTIINQIVSDTDNELEIKKDTNNIILKEDKVPTLADTLEFRVVGTKATHILKNGETIIRVSLKYFGDKKFWPYIALYNKHILKDVNNVSVGTQLLIPELAPLK